jgi:hypothetical protein
LRNEQTGYVGTEDILALTPEELLAQEQPEAPVDLGPLPRPGGVRRSMLPPSTSIDLPANLPASTDAETKAEGTPKPNE